MAAITVHRNFTLANVDLVTRDDLKALGEEALLIIRERTRKGVSVEGAPFKRYSPRYAEQKGAYTFSGIGSALVPDLTLTGEMLGNMQITDMDERNHTVTLGWVR